MPIHFNDLDVVSEVAGSKSALIVACNMCPAVTVAVRQKRPFLQLFRSLLTSPPFERYIKALRTRLRESGVETDIFRSIPYHQWFMCMWTSAKRRKLEKYAARYEAVIVLGCSSATATIRDVIKSNNCKVIEGMEVAGIMNAELSLSFPADVSFENCRTVPLSQ